MQKSPLREPQDRERAARSCPTFGCAAFPRPAGLQPYAVSEPAHSQPAASYPPGVLRSRATTPGKPPEPAVPGAAALAPRPGPRLWVTIGAHAVVDFFSFMILPLLTMLEGRLDLTTQQGAAFIALQPLASGLSQPIAAWLSDRYDSRLPGIFGMAVAIAAITMIGYAEAYWQLLAIQVVGTAGIGAFHPVAAASVGQLAGRRRSLFLAIFFVSGMSGGAVGAWVAPKMVESWGFEALPWLMPAGLVATGVLGLAIRRAPHRDGAARANHASLPARDRRGRWLASWLLFGGAAARYIVNMMLFMLVVRWAEAVVLARSEGEVLTRELRERASVLTGELQSALIVGMGVGGLALGSLLRPRHERAALVLVPILGAVVIALFARLEPGAFGSHGVFLLVAWLLGVGMGVGYAGLVPTTVSLGQRLLPHRTSLASGMMLGGAWLVGAVGPGLAQAIADWRGLVMAFDVAAAVLLLAGLSVLAIPRRLLEAGD